MQIKIYNNLPKEARDIRNEVFVIEQGFENEFDSTDSIAVHIVTLNEDEKPVATCRVFWDSSMNAYVLGRVAVSKKYRGNNLGKLIVKEAENYVKKSGGNKLLLHAQCRITDFYKKLGYEEFGSVEFDEDCPHIWMIKSF